MHPCSEKTHASAPQAVFMHQGSFTMFFVSMACVAGLVRMHSDFIVGGGKHRAASVTAVVQAGVAVMGHVGLLPQSISVLGGFRPQGQSAASALQVMEDALVGLSMLLDMSAHRHGNARAIFGQLYRVLQPGYTLTV